MSAHGSWRPPIDGATAARKRILQTAIWATQNAWRKANHHDITVVTSFKSLYESPWAVIAIYVACRARLLYYESCELGSWDLTYTSRIQVAERLVRLLSLVLIAGNLHTAAGWPRKVSLHTFTCQSCCKCLSCIDWEDLSGMGTYSGSWSWME